MTEWGRYILQIVDEIDERIRNEDDDALALKALSDRMGYSTYHMSRRFSEISGMRFRDYLRNRRLAFALKDLRDGEAGILEIALKYGFSSHAAFTRAFRAAFGMAPAVYRKNPVPVALRTVLRPFDCYLMEGAVTDMEANQSDVKVYFVKIPAHRFLHIRNYESIGYWDFWQREAQVPGCDCDTICGLLDSIPGKLDDIGGAEKDASSGQLMAWINEPSGRICSWGIPLAEAYGARLPVDYSGPVPPQMQLMDVAEGEYVVFEHGPFDFERENRIVEEKIEAAMKSMDYGACGYRLDTSPGRVFYFYHDAKRFWKYVKPVCRA